jgi:hypothetical protein
MLPKNPPTRPTTDPLPPARALYVAGPLARTADARAAVAPLPEKSPARRLWVLSPLRRVASADPRRRWATALRVLAGIAGVAAAAGLGWLAYLLALAVVAAVIAAIAWVHAHLFVIGAVVVAALVLLVKTRAGSRRTGCAGLHCRGCRH